MPADPSGLTGKLLWLRAKDLGTGSIGSWADQSGSGKSATPTGTAPTVATGSTPSGGKSVAFAGNGYFPFSAIMAPHTFAASGDAGASYVAAKAFDGTTTTCWALIGTSGWLRVAPVGLPAVTSYTISPYTGDAVSQAPRTWTFEGSMDASSWTTLDTRSGVTFTAATPQTFTFANSTAYTYYRLNVSANNGNAVLSVGELLLNNTSMSGPSEAEMWVVVKANSGNQGAPVHLSDSGNDDYYPFSGVVYDNFGGSRQSFTPTVSLTSWRIFRARLTASGRVWYLDNASQLSVAPSAIGWSTTARIGAGLTSSNSPTYFGGNIAEVLVVNHALSSTEESDLIAYFNTEHGLAVPGGTTAPTTTGTAPVTVGSSASSSLVPVVTGSAPVAVASSGRTIPVAVTTGPAPVAVVSSSNTSLIGIVPVTTGTAPVSVGSSSSTTLIVPTTTGGSPVSVESGSSTAVLLAATGQAPVTVASASRTYTIGAALAGAPLEVGVTVEVGPLTLLNLVTLPGVEVPVGVGLDTGDTTPVVPLPGVTVAVGMSLDARPVELRVTDPRHKRTQWRYVVTDLANKPLGELVDIQHDPVADGINSPTTMRFTMAADDPMRALIEDGEPLTRKCQVWAGNELLLWGPLLPDMQSDRGVAGYTVHDPSWWWRGGRRVIGRLPRKNLLKNGDFRQGLTYWSRGYDVDSIPKAAPDVRVVTEDFLNDTDGLDPIRAAEIVGVESVTQAELSSNAVFWQNLATFRPGGKAAIEAVANAMPTTTGLKVSVVGHTANDGTGNGLGLSARRAEAAKAVILTKRPHAVITTKGVGYYDPKPGFPIDSQEQRRVVISYDQTISGKSKQWMRQTLEVTQPKSAAYGLELTAAAMLKVADDWSVEDANMMSVRLVARRKSLPKKIWDESSASISDTDPVGRWIGQSTSITIPADDRPYLVDVYLYAPAALARYTAVGLFPEEELCFWGADQALIFKGIVEHIQDTSMGHGDLGIETRTPLTGIKRDRTYPFREHMPADTALEEFGGLNRGMDYDTIMRPDGRVILATFYPQQGKHTPYVLAQGSNVANASPERSRDVASSIIMQAQDLGSYRAETYAKDKRALGGLLLERVVTAEQGTPLNELSEAARQELAWGRLSTTGYWLDIDPDAIDDVLANTRKGDVIRLILDAPLPVDALARIVNRERHPDSLRLLVALDQEA